MHAMAANVIRLDRLECAGADVQGDFSDLKTLIPQLLQQAFGEMKPGRLNAITDVKGVKVGHCTVDSGEIQSGVTAVIPAEGNLFKNKVMAAVNVINGFGKPVGLTQIEEMGTIETPILLTNTLCVGGVTQALVKKMLGEAVEKNREEKEYFRNVYKS